jgi:hypothetical protein
MDNKVGSSFTITNNNWFNQYQECLASNTNKSCTCDTLLKKGLDHEVKKMDLSAIYYTIEDKFRPKKDN